jgi:anti-sigma factor RsiW
MRLFSPRPMICREAVEAMTAYLEGAMRPRARARFEAHIAACEHCTAYLEQIRVTIALTGTIAAEDLSPEAQRALQGVFSAWAAEGSRGA